MSIHPGWAKDKLVNAAHLAAKIVGHAAQATLTPETTSGRQGFLHIVGMSGSAAEMNIDIILRDFERDLLASQGELLNKVSRGRAGRSSRAPRSPARSRPSIATCAIGWRTTCGRSSWRAEACRQIGVEPFSVPVRGGTDGSRLTELGLPTPNVFTGMQEIHEPLEWISLQDMAAATEMCIRLAQLWAAVGPGEAKPEHGPESQADTGGAVDWTE